MKNSFWRYRCNDCATAFTMCGLVKYCPKCSSVDIRLIEVKKIKIKK